MLMKFQGSVWSRLGSDVTVVEYLGAIGGPGMDADMAKTMQKILSKQGMKFKLNTKVMGGDVNPDSIAINVEAAKGGKQETVGPLQVAEPTRNQTNIYLFSSTPTSSLSRSAAVPILPVSASKMSASRLTNVAVSSSTRNTAPRSLISV